MPSKQAPEQIYHEPEVADNLKPSPFFNDRLRSIAPKNDLKITLTQSTRYDGAFTFYLGNHRAYFLSVISPGELQRFAEVLYDRALHPTADNPIAIESRLAHPWPRALGRRQTITAAKVAAEKLSPEEVKIWIEQEAHEAHQPLPQSWARTGRPRAQYDLSAMTDCVTMPPPSSNSQQQKSAQADPLRLHKHSGTQKSPSRRSGRQNGAGRRRGNDAPRRNDKNAAPRRLAGENRQHHDAGRPNKKRSGTRSTALERRKDRRAGGTHRQQ